MKFKMFAVVVLGGLLAMPVMAQDDAAKAKEKGKRRGQPNVATQMLKQLSELNLTEEQTAKIKAMGAEAAKEMKAINTEAGLTRELMKKRAAAMKTARESGKKGKEMAAAVNEAAGLTEAQAAGFAKMALVRTKLQKGIVALLTDEQKANLPPAMKRMTSEKKGKGKGKKKDAA